MRYPNVPLPNCFHVLDDPLPIPWIYNIPIYQITHTLLPLSHLVAKGGFGEVWRGDLNGEPVAVKVISSLLEDCWKKEQMIYMTNMLHHESILRFIAVDSKLIGMKLSVKLCTLFLLYPSI